MVISGISGQAPGMAVPLNDADKASLNYDAFLKMLLEQLKSQDPTNPVDQTQSLAQLASFSSVEQSIKLNQKLELLLAQSGASEATSLIGKTVTSLVSDVSGIVKSVEIRPDGVSAILEDGSRLPVAQGLRIS
jgi:flagellar basal-body rod modification protein FlgD